MQAVNKIKDKLHISPQSADKEESQSQSQLQSTMAPNVPKELPKTYKAVVIEKAGAGFKLQDIPLEMPKKGEILLKNHACGVCHSDTFLEQGLFGPMGTFPRIPGHEVIGTVVAVGDDVEKWKVGDRAGGPWHGAHDGTCKACNRGLFQMCENELVNGVNRDGGYGEYCTLRAEAAVRIPDDVDPAEYAPLLCAGVTTFNGIRKMNITPGDVVAVQGLGGLGHLALQFIRKMGYRAVALSSSDAKRQFAMDLGATDYVDGSKEDTAEALQKMGGASLIVVTAPNPKLMGPLVKGCGPCGRLLLLAPVGEVPVDTVTMIGKGIGVFGWPSGHALDSEECISFAQHQGVKCLVEKFPLEQYEKAIERMTSGGVRFRAVLTMD